MTEIRLATVPEADAACVLLHRCILQCCVEDHRNEPEILQKWLGNITRGTVESWFAWPTHYSLVAIERNKLVGLAMMSRPGKIVLLHVDPEYRHNGIGSSLLLALERRTMKTGSTILRVASSFSARTFFESRGFDVLGPFSAAYGPALTMVKPVPACSAIDSCASADTTQDGPLIYQPRWDHRADSAKPANAGPAPVRARRST